MGYPLTGIRRVPAALSGRGWSPLHAVEGCTQPGRRLCRETMDHGGASRLSHERASGRSLSRVRCLSGDGDLPGDGPHEGHPCPRAGDHPLMGVCAPGAQRAVACAQPSVGRPTDLLHRVGPRCESPRERAAHLGRIAGGPGPVDQCPPGRGVARLGDPALATSVSTGLCRGDATEITHQRSGVVHTGEVATCRHEGDGHDAVDAASALEGLDHRLKTPRSPVRLACWCKTLEACGLLGDRPDIVLEDAWLGRSRTDHCTAPPEMGRAPGGPAHGAEIVSKLEGVEPTLGGLESAAGLFTRSAQVATGVIVNRGDGDGCQVTRAPQAGQCDGVSTVSWDPGPWRLGDQGGGDDPADMACWGAIAGEPRATWAGCIDQDEVRACGWPPTDQVSEVTLSRPDSAAGDDLSVVGCGDLGDRDRVLMDS